MIKTIKNFFLSNKKQAALKEISITRTNIDYAKAKNIGVLFLMNEKQSTSSLNKLIDNIVSGGKKVSVLAYYEENPDMVFNFPLEPFSLKDFTLTAQLKNENVQRFINTDFDYLFCVSSEQVPAMEYVLACCKAKCRIGQSAHYNQPLFEITIQSDNHQKTIDKLIYYTRVLCHH